VGSQAPTLHDVFRPTPDDREGLSSARMKHLEDALGKEFDGLEWTASMPDVFSKIAELLDIPVSGVFVASWTKATAIQKALDESNAAPRDVLYVSLADHTIRHTQRPYISVQIARLPPKNIELTVEVSFVLKGFTLTIQRGAIQEIRTGSCEVEGTLECLGVHVKKKPTGFDLPGAIPVQDDEHAHD
jgi:hypothetical protein